MSETVIFGIVMGSILSGCVLIGAGFALWDSGGDVSIGGMFIGLLMLACSVVGIILLAKGASTTTGGILIGAPWVLGIFGGALVGDN